MRQVPEPRLDRDIELHMMGDWGIANLHRICGWLAAEIGARSGPGSRFATWNGRGGRDAVDAVLDGRVDTALFVPACFGRNVIERKGISNRPDVDKLRAIATLPQDDRLVIVADAALKIRTLEDIRQSQPVLHIAAGLDDGCNMVGYATHRMLDAAGLPRATIESWGGSFIEGEAPWDVIQHGLDGTANMVIFEAIMLPLWNDMLRQRDMVFIPIDDDLLIRLDHNFAMPRGTVPAGRFHSVETPFETLDFSNFLLMCREDMPDDLAYAMAWCVCQTTETIESQYRHMAPEDSPLTYPLDPVKMARTSVPLHNGAARYYRDAGLLP